MVNIVEPKVKLLASTRIDDNAIHGQYPYKLGDMGLQVDSTDAESLTTFAGRSCYNSFHRPSGATRLDEDYLRRTIFEQGHGSILEHASATVYITGVSRAFLAELTRHRHLSFSVQSQRFVDESDCNVVMPPAIRTSSSGIYTAWESGIEQEIESYKQAVFGLEFNGEHTRKQIREAARSLLPNAVETKMVVTGNFRAWFQVIDRRIKPDADAEMQEVTELIRQELVPLSPTIFRKGNFK